MTTTIAVPSQLLDQYHEAITRSMVFLDDYLGGPDWVNRIDLDELDLEDGSSCVCGQLFDRETGMRTVDDMRTSDGYDYALKHVVEHGVPEGFFDDAESEFTFHITASRYLGFSIDGEAEEDILAKHNGFESASTMWQMHGDDLDVLSPWEILTQTWRERIEKRRAELGTLA